MAKEKEAPETLGTSAVAKLLKIDGKRLRTILRKNKVEKDEGRYAWKPDSKMVTTTLPKMVAEYEEDTAREKAEKPAKKAATKKAAKKATKKAAAKKAEPEELEEVA